jgi:hypothetical protein
MAIVSKTVLIFDFLSYSLPGKATASKRWQVL